LNAAEDARLEWLREDLREERVRRVQLEVRLRDAQEQIGALKAQLERERAKR